MPSASLPLRAQNPVLVTLSRRRLSTAPLRLSSFPVRRDCSSLQPAVSGVRAARLMRRAKCGLTARLLRLTRIPVRKQATTPQRMPRTVSLERSSHLNHWSPGHTTWRWHAMKDLAMSEFSTPQSPPSQSPRSSWNLGRGVDPAVSRRAGAFVTVCVTKAPRRACCGRARGRSGRGPSRGARRRSG
jgi:hypothetical protein